MSITYKHSSFTQAREAYFLCLRKKEEDINVPLSDLKPVPIYPFTNVFKDVSMKQEGLQHPFGSETT